MTVSDRQSYPGGKGNCYRQIINRMPPHETFIDAFAGGGSIVLNKKPAMANIVIDRDEVPLSHLSAAVSSKKAIGQGCASPDTSIDAASGDGKWKIYQADAIEWLRSRLDTFGEGVLIYLDPPYLPETRKGGDLYKYELNAQDHHAILDVAISLKCYVMISGYWSQMYTDALKGWHYSEFPNMTRGGVVTESLWCNFESNGVLHDYQYTGSDFRERERIKRKTHRHVSRLMALPAVERNCIVNSIVGIHKDSRPSLISAVSDPAMPARATNF